MPPRALLALTVTAFLLVTGMVAPAQAGRPADPPGRSGPPEEPESPRESGLDKEVRFATFNASLNRGSEGDLIADLSSADNEQAQNVAETIQRVRPDVVLINEFDYVESGVAAELFAKNYLAVGQQGAEPIVYPYVYLAPSNTGVDSGVDLNNDGSLGGPDDAFGFGLFPGQYGMVAYSAYPIEVGAIRTFQTFRWADMPGNLMPTDYYSPDAQEVLRLSSKSHWDVPILIGKRTVHLLAAHPTPPTFDGPEDRNGRRNQDEIRFWADYVGGADYMYDDAGVYGGLEPGAKFVIAGDYNADPRDGDSSGGAINQLLDHPKVNTSVTPSSAGAVEQAEQGGVNDEHAGDPAYDTADFGEPPGNLRVDYVLPSRSLPITAAAVFWPVSTDPMFQLVGIYPFPTSDHRLVWVDVKLPKSRPSARFAGQR